MKFYIPEEDSDKIHEWVKNHNCTVNKTGAIGGVLTYKFTPTSLGTVFKVLCACGEELDLSDYGSW